MPGASPKRAPKRPSARLGRRRFRNRENRNLYARIREKGCVISEFPCGSFPPPQNFPIRNRIISGLCLGTLITEASEFSGSLITARLTFGTESRDMGGPRKYYESRKLWAQLSDQARGQGSPEYSRYPEAAAPRHRASHRSAPGIVPSRATETK